MSNAPMAQIVVVENVYHQELTGQPGAIQHRWARWLDTDKQVYSRKKFVVNGEWAQIDVGWIGNDCGMLHLHNSEGTNLQVNPTEAEKAETQAKIVHVAVRGPDNTMATFARLRPTETLRFEPLELRRIYLWCEQPETQDRHALCTITLFPI